ncbi:MAG: hypothetical protein ACTHJR_18105 [Sphingomonas sp.]|uniref:hypothetical protein n=1 Tax=Sphingomonas sp. TaxID=28214 RepID=UPI003F7EB80C
MNLTWLKDDERFVRTETEAKKSGQDWETYDIPTTSKDAMMDWLNNWHRKPVAAPEPQEIRPPVAISIPNNFPPPPTPNLDVIEVILESGGEKVINILYTALERLGELRTAGYNQLRKILADDPKTRTSLERGLGYLLTEVAPSAQTTGEKGSP